MPRPSSSSPSSLSLSLWSSPLQNLKKNVDERQAKLSQAKGEYKTALRNLEMISDEIHERRRSSAMGPRGRGVGAEGDSVSGDDISNFKMESDGISSECCTQSSPSRVYFPSDDCADQRKGQLVNVEPSHLAASASHLVTL